MLYLKRGLKKQSTKEKVLMFGYAGFLLGTTLLSFFCYIYLLYVPGTYEKMEFYGNLNDSGFYFTVFGALRVVFYYLGLTIFILAYEIAFKRSHFILSIIMSVLITIITLFYFISYDTYLVIASFLLIVAGTICFFILIVYTKASQLEYRAISCYFILSFIFAGYGYSLSAKIVYIKEVVPIWVQPLLFCIVGVLMIYPLFTGSRDFLKTLKFWSFTGIITIIVLIIFTILFYISNLGIPWVIPGIYFSIFIIYMRYLILKDMKEYKASNLASSPLEHQSNIFGAFARPSQISEEEISISKEKKICLVCKGKVSGFDSYLCKCDAIYCQKCAKILSTTENACWVYKAPFDESKPQNTVQFKEEKVLIDQETHDYEKNSKK